MAFVLDKVSEDTFFDNLLLGLQKTLEKNLRIKNFVVEHIPGVCNSDISNWELHYSMRLPEDLKEFYLSSNGFKLTWQYTFSDNETIEIGSIHIYSLQDLICITGYKSAASVELKKSFDGKILFKPGPETRVYQLAYVDDNTKVCLVYYNFSTRTPPTIWLLDGDYNWHFLAKNIKCYLRMCIAHLGMPLWQYCFTPYGVPQWVEQIFIMTTPHLDTAQPVLTNKDERTEGKNYQLNILDLTLFKPKQRKGTQTSETLLKYRKK